jgi:hypothetical protein
MSIRTRTKSLWDAASSASKAVWIFLIIETLVIAGLAGLVAELAADIAQRIAFDRLPPWSALAVLLVASALAQLVQAAHPIVAARRWHGVLVRRIDERWGDER